MDREALCRAIATAQTAVDVQDPEWGEQFAQELALAGYYLIPLTMLTELQNSVGELSKVVKVRKDK